MLVAAVPILRTSMCNCQSIFVSISLHSEGYYSIKRSALILHASGSSMGLFSKISVSRVLKIPSFDAYCPGLGSPRHLLLKSPLLVRVDRYEDDDSPLMTCCTCVAMDARKPSRLCLHCWHRAYANSTLGSACCLSPSFVQAQPIAVPSSCSTLVVSRRDL